MKMQSEITGKGKPLVLVPGGLTGWESWKPFVKIFAEHHTVILLQLLGVQYGLENRALPKDYSVKTESDAMLASLNALDIEKRFDIVAWSFGAFTSLNFALDHPEKILTLTLIEPPAMWVLRETNKWDDEAQQTADYMQQFHGEITDDQLAGFLKHAGFLLENQSARDLPQWNYWLPFKRSLRINPFVVSHSDSIERLRNFEPPTLLVKGTGSTPWLHHVIDGLSENIPHSRVVEFAGGHAPHLVSREQFLKKLEHFLKTSGGN